MLHTNHYTRQTDKMGVISGTVDGESSSGGGQIIVGEDTDVNSCISEGHVKLVVPHLPGYGVSPLMHDGNRQARLVIVAGGIEEVRNTGAHVLKTGDIRFFGLQHHVVDSSS